MKQEVRPAVLRQQRLSCRLQGFAAEQALPEQVQAAGSCAVAALAALVMHLKRIKAFDELAKSSTILPYGVRLAFELPVS